MDNIRHSGHNWWVTLDGFTYHLRYKPRVRLFIRNGFCIFNYVYLDGQMKFMQSIKL